MGYRIIRLTDERGKRLIINVDKIDFIEEMDNSVRVNGANIALNENAAKVVADVMERDAAKVN